MANYRSDFLSKLFFLQNLIDFPLTIAFLAIFQAVTSGELNSTPTPSMGVGTESFSA
jgi:hypothetical protein